MLVRYVFKNRLRIFESQISQNMLMLARLRFGFCNSKKEKCMEKLIDTCHIIGLSRIWSFATKERNSININTCTHTLEKLTISLVK